MIQTRLRDGWSFRKIAREIGCSVNTVRNEYSRGKVLLYNGKIERYRAEDGQAKYEANRENCGRKHWREKNFSATLWKISTDFFADLFRMVDLFVIFPPNIFHLGI